MPAYLPACLSVHTLSRWTQKLFHSKTLAWRPSCSTKPTWYGRNAHLIIQNNRSSLARVILASTFILAFALTPLHPRPSSLPSPSLRFTRRHPHANPLPHSPPHSHSHSRPTLPYPPTHMFIHVPATSPTSCYLWAISTISKRSSRTFQRGVKHSSCRPRSTSRCAGMPTS